MITLNLDGIYFEIWNFLCVEKVALLLNTTYIDHCIINISDIGSCGYRNKDVLAPSPQETRVALYNTS